MKRNASLDFIKVVATILIVCHHFQQVLDVHFGKINFYDGRFLYGYLVELFFIISGICAYNWIETIAEKQTFKEFYLKRMLRLLPLTTLSVVVASMESVLYFYVKKSWWFNQPFSISGALFAAFGIQAGWASGNPMINNPIWYVSVLLLCYAVMYFTTCLAKRIGVSPFYFYIGMIFIGVGVASYGLNMPFLNSFSARGYMGFFAGLLYAKIAGYTDIQKKWIQLTACVVFICQIIFIYKGLAWNMGMDVIFVLWPSLLILSQSKLVQKFLRGEFWSKWAETSFSVYIWHCILLIGYLFVPRESAGWLYSGWGLLFTIVVLQIIGILSNRFIERPLNKYMKEKVYEKICA